MKCRTTVLLAIGAVLVAGPAFQLLPLRNLQAGDVLAAPVPIGLKDRIPRSLPGWNVTEEPLGPTEFVQSAVQRTLNYDDVVNRIYRKGATNFGVYVAYWSAGRMPVQKVASHTPDRCWTENGWSCEEMRFDDKFRFGGIQLRPAQWRLFDPPQMTAEKEYVLYWHLVGDRLYDYGHRFNARPDLVKWWRDTLAYSMAGSASQYFIRLTSNRPFEELEGDIGFQEVLRSLAQLGLADRV